MVWYAAVVWLVLGMTAVVAGQGRTVAVPSARAWTDTGIELQPGDPVHIEASGVAWAVGPRMWERLVGSRVDRGVGPRGTHVWPRTYPLRAGQPAGSFPLPAMGDGPFPAFCLIGRIGTDGRPFYVGERYDGLSPAAGRLWLGINDDRPEDNRGDFRATVMLERRVPTPDQEAPPIEPGQRPGGPVPGARVLLVYIDGLRADVLREMANAGFLPNLKRTFLDCGLAIPDAFTVFPSNTLIANGSLFTGLFPDRTGIKSQNQFERSTLKPKGQLSRWLPDGFMPRPHTRVINLLDKYAPEHTHGFLVTRGVPTLATRLGKAYRFTTLPIAPLNPPPQWLHRAINTIGPFSLSGNLPMKLDEVNAQYATEEILGDPDARVIAVWLPMVDKTSHHSPRGQFGAARRDLALADRCVGRILERLRQVGWDRTTYLVLVSDHGHLGGDASVNQGCHLPRDWAHGQLGCNAKVVGQEWTHPGIDPSRFFYFDNQGAGQVKLFLPFGSYFHGAWRRNRLAELTRYMVRSTQPPVNVLESLRQFRPPGWAGTGGTPVDLILVKLDAQRTLVYRRPDCQAIIHREDDSAVGEVYRYEPVQHLSQSDDGLLHAEPPLRGVDPLGYLQDPGFRDQTADPEAWLRSGHTAREWLLATYRSRYPDAVVAMAKFFAWSGRLSDLADVRDPDLVVTASEGWSFRSDDSFGTDHGYPLADSMRISFFIAGPNIPHGVFRSPQRIIDVLPTMLDMVRWPYDPAELDGRALAGIYD